MRSCLQNLNLTQRAVKDTIYSSYKVKYYKQKSDVYIWNIAFLRDAFCMPAAVRLKHIIAGGKVNGILYEIQIILGDFYTTRVSGVFL